MAVKKRRMKRVSVKTKRRSKGKKRTGMGIYDRIMGKC